MTYAPLLSEPSFFHCAVPVDIVLTIQVWSRIRAHLVMEMARGYSLFIDSTEDQISE